MSRYPSSNVPSRALRRLFRLAHVLALGLLTAVPAHAQSGMGADVVTVDILPGWREAGGTHYAGVRIRLAPGWKTYWRTPGDGGIPPLFMLDGSSNLARFEPLMPRPTVFDTGGLRSIGYTDEVVFPLALTATDANGPIVLDGSMFIGVCDEICMPAEIRLEAALTAPGQSSALIATALRAQPEVLLGQVSCSFSPTPDGLRVRVDLDAPRHPDEIAVIELADPTLWVSHSETSRQGNRLVAASDIVSGSNGPITIDRSKLRVTVLSPNAAYEVRGCAPS